MEQEASAVRRQLPELQAAAAAASSRSSDYSNSAAAKAATADRQLAGLRAESQRVNLSGLADRLGNLGALPAHLASAAAAAAPSAMDSLVVEDTQPAQTCVDILRRKGLGKATFLILEQLRRQQQRYGHGHPSDFPAERLVDQVVLSDERFRPAFYWAFRDTLVADDLERARRLAFSSGNRRHRVVTLDGFLIDSFG